MRGDVLLVSGREEQVRQLPDVTVGRETRATGYFTNPLVQTAELVIAPRAAILGTNAERTGVPAAIWGHRDRSLACWSLVSHAYRRYSPPGR